VIKVEHLYKVFGKNPDQAMQLLAENHSRDDIREKTGQVLALEDVSFTVPDREIFVVMGLSGSGKSTLIRCINRLIEPTKGCIFVDDDDILGMSQNALINFRRKKMSMIFQSFAIFPFRNVFDNVKFGLEIQKEKKEIIEEKVLQTLELVGLAEWKEAFPTELSGGMQQRVGTARALVNDPDILLMDEPFSALDPLIRNHMQDELLDLQKRVGKTIIFITHDFNEALKIGDRCAILKDGRVIQMGTALEILRQPANEFVMDFSRDINRLNLLTAQDVMVDGAVSVIDLENDPPDRALEVMKVQKIACCCVKSQNRLKGVVSFDSINAAVSKKEATLKGVQIEEIPRESIVSPELLVKELCSIMSESDIPVVVMDSGEKVLGIITRPSVFGVLGEE
jgi:glycine betaine/proline transport system ATP-binding protein